MADTCECYRTRERQRCRYSPISGAVVGSEIETVGYCVGTKERDTCACGGDATKCDFYPEKRNRKQRKVEVESVVQLNSRLQAENEALHNELCLRCGKYKDAHNGACDGCRRIDRLRMRKQYRVRLSEAEQEKFEVIRAGVAQKAISQMVVEAREPGLSYGQYVARGGKIE